MHDSHSRRVSRASVILSVEVGHVSCNPLSETKARSTWAAISVFSKRGPLKAELRSIWFSLQVASLLEACFNPVRFKITAEVEMARAPKLPVMAALRGARLMLLREFIMDDVMKTRSGEGGLMMKKKKRNLSVACNPKKKVVRSSKFTEHENAISSPE